MVQYYVCFALWYTWICTPWPEEDLEVNGCDELCNLNDNYHLTQLCMKKNPQKWDGEWFFKNNRFTLLPLRNYICLILFEKQNSRIHLSLILWFLLLWFKDASMIKKNSLLPHFCQLNLCDLHCPWSLNLQAMENHLVKVQFKEN